MKTYIYYYLTILISLYHGIDVPLQSERKGRFTVAHAKQSTRWHWKKNIPLRDEIDRLQEERQTHTKRKNASY